MLFHLALTGLILSSVKAAPAVTETDTSSTFTYTQVTSTRYATPLHSPLVFHTPFAPPFSEVSTLLPPGATYTTYSLDPEATLTPDGQYGQSAYAVLWSNLSYTSPPPFTTRVIPSPSPRLPHDFMWGMSAAAWQIEGGLQIDGRGPSDMDHHGAIQSKDGRDDANTATMNYWLYKDDIARLAAIGIPYLSLTIPWTRIIPFGVTGSPINTKGLEHYDDVINTCLEYGITLMMDDFSTLPENFLYYAKQVMTRYADRVPYWYTFNEPNVGVEWTLNGWNDLIQMNEAHADVYHWYKNELKGTGKISMKMANNLALPLDPSNKTHVQAALRYQEFILGIMNNAIFLGQQIPAQVLATADLDLTPLTDAQIAMFNGTADFFAFDPYISQFASPTPEGIDACAANSSSPAWPYCVTTSMVQADDWLMGHPGNAYSAIAPQYVRQQLGYVWKTFKPAGGILLAEFGYNPFGEGARNGDAQRFDLERTLYYQNFLNEMLKAIHEDGVRVIGTMAWSYVDNNEWGSFEEQYGLQTVNHTDGSFDREFKRSMFDYVDFFHDHIEVKL